MSSRIRPLQREDVAQVVSLYERVMRSGARQPPPGLRPYFERIFLEHPWVDPDIPSLVYESDDGMIHGFLGSHVRRLRYDDTPVRMGCSGQLVADPSVRKKGVGTLLTRHYLAGPQDLSITDGATDQVRPMWERLGGHTAFLRSLSWTRILQPWRVTGGALLDRAGRATLKSTTRPIWSVLDAITHRLPGALFRVPEPPTHVHPLEPAAVVEHLPRITGHLRLCPDYDEAFLRCLFDEMAVVRTRGELVRCLVSEPGGRVLGWYVAYLQPGGISQVMQIAAAPRDVGAVVDQLLHHAQRSGTAAVRGRLEPLLFEVSQRRCVLRHSEQALLHSRERPDVVSAIVLGEGMLTRMDGEWWMGHHIEPFTSGGA